MAELVVTFALETIRDLLVAEGKFLFGVRDQVEELRAELEALQSFLKDANARMHEDERLHTCVNQAKRLAHRAEDIIEEYVIKIASKRGEGFRKAARRVAGIVGEGITIHEVGNEIGKINTEISHLIKRLEGYGINRIIQAQPSSATIEKQRRLRATYAHEVDAYFVGMKDDVSKIVTWVTEDDKIRQVISICGIGGLGKTTIAREVYNHRRVQSSFQCFVWVCVTQQCHVKMLMQDILIQILGDKERYRIRDMEEDELVRKLYNLLEKRKCFVVLDDIWKLDDWESLRAAFPIVEGSSKILLTTRIRQVAEVAHRHSQHEPTLLDEKNGWDLLTKIAFNLQEDDDNELLKTVETVGRGVLHKCGGLPLAIAALGGILRRKDTLIEWETINKKFGTHLRENGGIVSVLSLSYDDLPAYLKPCFLYMGCFREDEEIDVMHLYQLWMAEGLIPSRNKGPGETLMDVANDFLDELISQNMLQPQVRNVLVDKKFCRLHDLVRELCVMKGSEEQFVMILRCDTKGRSVCFDNPDKYRHATLIDTQAKLMGAVELMYDTNFRALVQNSFLQRVMKFRRLRSLVLENCGFKNNKLPKELRDMIHLRYLSLQHTLRYGKLPSFIGDLLYLQTLNIANNDNLQLPNIFPNMKRLRYLYLPEYRWQPMNDKRLEFHGLNELEVVEGFDTRFDEITHLSQLVNLRRFCARISSYENLFAILVQLSFLVKVQYISITFDTEGSGSQLEKSFSDVKKLLLCRCLCNLHLRAPIGNFPRYEPQLWPDLVYLELYNTKFENDPMPFLQELPNLRELHFKYNVYLGKEMYCSSKASPKLTSLEIVSLKNIEKWRVDAGAFPNLSTFEIGYCKSFEIVPHGLTKIISLTRIDIHEEMPKDFRIKYGSICTFVK